MRRGWSGWVCNTLINAHIPPVHDICLFQMNKQTLEENCCKFGMATDERWWWWWWRWKMIKVSHLNVFLMYILYACLHTTIILLSWLFKRKFTTTPFLVLLWCVCMFVCVCVIAIFIFKVALNCLSRPNNKSALEMLFTIIHVVLLTLYVTNTEGWKNTNFTFYINKALTLVIEGFTNFCVVIANFGKKNAHLAPLSLIACWITASVLLLFIHEYHIKA